MCIHPKISSEEERNRVDSFCRKLTSPWNRAKAHTRENTLQIEELA